MKNEKCTENQREKSRRTTTKIMLENYFMRMGCE